jgi:hypothetical protein
MFILNLQSLVSIRIPTPIPIPFIFISDSITHSSSYQIFNLWFQFWFRLWFRFKFQCSNSNFDSNCSQKFQHSKSEIAFDFSISWWFSLSSVNHHWARICQNHSESQEFLVCCFHFYCIDFDSIFRFFPKYILGIIL